MTRLISSYRKLPSSANRQRLIAYLAKHPFALCGATPDEMAFLKANEFV